MSMRDDLSDKLFKEITPESSQADLEDLIDMIPTDPDYDTYFTL
ncbi:MAG: hypothetical protein QGH40_10460 [bacterium]|jgi:hypothetical protein|nr:hypothetical protein [bacterium]